MLAIILAAVSLLSGAISQQNATYAAAGQLDVATPSGAIGVTVGGDRILVSITRKADTAAQLASIAVEASRTARGLALRAVMPEKCAGCSVAFTLTVPSGTRLDLQTGNGRVDGAGLDADVRFATSTGSVYAAYADASRVRYIGLSSRIGRVTLALPASARPGRVRMRTLVGRINSAWPLAGDLQANVVGASADQTIEPGGADIEMSTLTGSLNLVKL